MMMWLLKTIQKWKCISRVKYASEHSFDRQSYDPLYWENDLNWSWFLSIWMCFEFEWNDIFQWCSPNSHHNLLLLLSASYTLQSNSELIYQTCWKWHRSSHRFRLPSLWTCHLILPLPCTLTHSPECICWNNMKSKSQNGRKDWMWYYL